MAIALSSNTMLRPGSLDEALRLMRDHGPLEPLAGCTDVYVGLQSESHSGRRQPRRFIDVWSLSELRGIGRAGKRLRLGALTTYTDLIRSPLVRRRLPMLVAAAREVGGRQIQHRGTIGGNIANASPAGDALPVLTAAEAVVILRHADGERQVPISQFFTGYRTTVRRSDELIVAVEIPPVAGKQYWRKVGTRRAQAISKVMCAAVRGDTVRVSFGSVAPTVIRVPRTEALLESSSPLDQATLALAEEVAPIDDLRSTAEYRRRVCANLLADFWSQTA